jgi:hypothetical protein
MDQALAVKIDSSVQTVVHNFFQAIQTPCGQTSVDSPRQQATETKPFYLSEKALRRQESRAASARLAQRVFLKEQQTQQTTETSPNQPHKPLLKNKFSNKILKNNLTHEFRLATWKKKNSILEQIETQQQPLLIHPLPIKIQTTEPVLQPIHPSSSTTTEATLAETKYVSKRDRTRKEKRVAQWKEKQKQTQEQTIETAVVSAPSKTKRKKRDSRLQLANSLLDFVSRKGIANAKQIDAFFTASRHCKQKTNLFTNRTELAKFCQRFPNLFNVYQTGRSGACYVTSLQIELQVMNDLSRLQQVHSDVDLIKSNLLMENEFARYFFNGKRLPKLICTSKREYRQFLPIFVPQSKTLPILDSVGKSKTTRRRNRKRHDGLSLLCKQFSVLSTSLPVADKPARKRQRRCMVLLGEQLKQMKLDEESNS